MKSLPSSTAAWLLLLATSLAAAEQRGYQREVPVANPTRLDWVFTVANQSPAEPPAEWTEGYESTAQKYELFVPPKYSAKTAWPLVLFISPGGDPAGWGAWKELCEKEGIFFASPFAAGNDCPMPRRVRIVLDVLDDLRRTYRIDADRTYLGGFSGGGRTACGIAFALPEACGGVIPVCAGGDLRPETWLRHRVAGRLSIALVTGENDFNRSEVERFRGPLFSGMGVENKVWTVPGLGHGIPGGDAFAPVYQFLEAGVARRRTLAKTWPATRLAPDAAPSREAQAAELLAEAQKRLKQPKSLYSGLMLLQGVSTRWPDVAPGQTALQLLTEYDSRTERPWDADDVAEQRTALIARARALDGYASGPLPAQYAPMRGDMLEAAINLWQQVVEDGVDKQATAQAKERLPELQALLEKEQQ